MKTTKLITLLTLAFISLGSSTTKAQDVGPIKVPVIKGGSPHMVEFIINGNVAIPNGSGIQSSLKFNPASWIISSIKTCNRSACEYPSSAISLKWMVFPSLAKATEQFLVAVSMLRI